MKSMTGYGQAQEKSPDAAIEIGVRTVNGRFLETRVHLPREYIPFENEMKKLVSSKFRRGTVDVYISRAIDRKSKGASVKVRTDLAKQWAHGYKTLAKSLKVDAELSLDTLISQENVLSLEEDHTPSGREKKAVVSTLQKAILACDSEREREGKFLKKDIVKNLNQLEKLMVRMKKTRQSANKLLEGKLQQRWKKLNFPGEVDKQRVAQEIVIQIDKSDISEEITRLGEHIQRMKALVEKGGVIGKKMDFYTQELLRETNTIGSKSGLAQLTELVVNAKTTVEQIREQVQNIE